MSDHFATGVVAADPDEVFRLITTPDRLPEWNPVIVDVVDAPEGLTANAQWVVTVSAMNRP